MEGGRTYTICAQAPLHTNWLFGDGGGLSLDDAVLQRGATAVEEKCRELFLLLASHGRH